MSPEQKKFFQEKGCLVLRGCLARTQIEPVKRHIFDELKRLKIWASGRSLSSRLDGVPPFQQVIKLGSLVSYPGLLARICPEELVSEMTSLAGTRLVPARDAQLLLSLPDQGIWTLDTLNWHVDISPPKPEQIPGVQAFVLIDDLLPKGGATLALSGSHLLKITGEQAFRNVRQALKNLSHTEAQLQKMGLEVVEMSGRAGDVYLMDMRTLHTPSINSSSKPRMMATTRYLVSP
jgi:hypothetical protein